jgi:hypothetical protein
MMSALEILAIWLAFDIAIGIPIWMLLKVRDRREERSAEKFAIFSSANTSQTLKTREGVSRLAAYG